MAYLFIFIVGMVVASCQHSSEKRHVANITAEENARDEKAAKRYFKNISAEDRLNILGQAEIFVDDYNASQVPHVDLIAETTANCGPQFVYQKRALELRQSSNQNRHRRQQSTLDETLAWPVISCRYHQDDTMDLAGGSTKFLCDFDDSSKRKGFSTKKVRYASRESAPLDSEVVETTVASNLAKLVGFPTKTFCPASIECKGCPSRDPWRDRRASVPASNKNYFFQWGMLENSLDVLMVSESTEHNAPNGVQWEEAKVVAAHSNEERQRKLIEREAWILWIHFVQNTDAGHFNLRLSCQDHVKNADGSFSCVKPILYTHDHGHSFHRHMNYPMWSRIPVLQKASDGAGCRAGLTSRNAPRKGQLPDMILGAAISSEARDLLLSRLRVITEKQWKDAFHLGRAGEATGVSTAQWLQDIQTKLTQIEQAPCLPFSSGRSVLYN